jgi:DinB superfamily
VDLETLPYPIGRSAWYIENGPQNRSEWLQTIADTPVEVRRIASGLTESQLDTPYRPGGWTVRQVVHHYADDHLNSYVRFKLALTENEPAIKGYGEALWAELPDARLGPLEPSLSLLEACTSAGLRPGKQWRNQTGSERFTIPSGARFLWNSLRPCMPDMGNITWHRFVPCADETVGRKYPDWGAVPPQLGVDGVTKIAIWRSDESQAKTTLKGPRRNIIRLPGEPSSDFVCGPTPASLEASGQASGKRRAF